MAVVGGSFVVRRPNDGLVAEFWQTGRSRQCAALVSLYPCLLTSGSDLAVGVLALVR